MKLIIAIFSGSLIFFFAIIYILINLDIFKSGSTAKKNKAPQKKTPPKNKLIFIFVFVLTVLAIAAGIAFLPDIFNIEDSFTKAELQKQKLSENDKKTSLKTYDKHMDFLRKIGSEDYTNTPPHLDSRIDSAKESNNQHFKGKDDLLAISALPEQNEAFGEEFIPATKGFHPFGRPDTPRIPEKPENKKDKIPAMATLRNGRTGDIFIAAFYDKLKDGRFTQSKGLHLLPASDINKERNPDLNSEYITVNAGLPALTKNTGYQLPLLLSGAVSPQTLNKGNIIISKNGIIKALTDTNKRNIEYKIARTGKPAKISFNPQINEWLEKEFESIPAQILDFLITVKDKPEFVKLASTAAILNAYFGYQAGKQEIILKPGKTWNSMLKKAIETKGRLLCDCDVLSTFSFIYLKYLELNPVFIIGYFNSPFAINELRADELHACLYLETGKKRLLFEPTLFVPNFMADKKIPENEDNILAGYPDLVKNILKTTDIDYFNLPEAIRSKLNYIDPDRSVQGRLADLIIEILTISQKKAAGPDEVSTGLTYIWEKTVQFSIIIHILCLLITKLILVAVNPPQRLVSLNKTRSLLYSLALILLLANLFFRSAGKDFSLWVNNHPLAAKTGALICVIAAIISIYSSLRLIIPHSHLPKARNRLQHLLESNGFILSGLFFGLAAIFYSPGTLTFAAVITIITILYLRIKSYAV